MLEPVKALMLQLLAVPPEPSLPAGSAATARVFRASRRYLQLKLLRWAAAQAATLIGLIVAIVIYDLIESGVIDLARSLPFAALVPVVMRVLQWLDVFGLIAFVIQLPLTVLPVILDWELRWYIVTDRSLRIREGVWKVSEMTMTFANVQEVSIEQGPLERLLGIADVKVRSAGGGGGGTRPRERHREQDSGHIGYFRGVDGAAAIRDLILERLKRQRDAGIEPIEAVAEIAARPPAGTTPELLDAARELLEEARALRRSYVG